MLWVPTCEHHSLVRKRWKETLINLPLKQNHSHSRYFVEDICTHHISKGSIFKTVIKKIKLCKYSIKCYLGFTLMDWNLLSLMTKKDIHKQVQNCSLCLLKENGWLQLDYSAPCCITGHDTTIERIRSYDVFHHPPKYVLKWNSLKYSPVPEQIYFPYFRAYFWIVLFLPGFRPLRKCF